MAAAKNWLKELEKAVAALRKQGYTVSGRYDRLNDEGTSEGAQL
jgi:hypothetical protein